MFKRTWTSVVMATLIMGGCAATENAFVSMRHYTQGEYYLQNNRYEECIARFTSETKSHPNDDKAHYYLGRCQLALEQNKPALGHMKQALALDLGNPDYHFWTGVAFAANGQAKRERLSYKDALVIKPDHVQALVYLGHNRIEAGRYRHALGYYNRALKEDPLIASALYNRALALRRLQRTPEEIKAWNAYLSAYPDGAFARQAAEYLNTHGRFDYRNHIIGKRTLTLAQMRFKPSSARLSKSSFAALNKLAAVTANNTKLTLHIMAYQKNNLKLAEVRAKSVKKFILAQEGGIDRARIKVSWFDQPETVMAGRRTHRLDSSINFFGQAR